MPKLSKRKKEQSSQKRQAKRGAYERERKKTWDYYKNIGRIDLYNQQQAGVKTIFKTVKSSEGPGIPKLSRWQRFINFIKRFLKRKKHAKNLL